MQRAEVLVEQRKHPRARLGFAARIRWRGPIGMRLEVTETIDVSRDGVLLHRQEDSLAMMSRIWIVFPFSADTVTKIEPETPARVVRVERDPGGGYRVGLQLQPPSRASNLPAQRERRASPRNPFALPIFVRPSGTPWPEETMTRNFSRTGVEFETSHIYAAGDAVLAQFPWGEWAGMGELSGRVVRVDPINGQPPANEQSPASADFRCVAVQWTDPRTSRGTNSKIEANPRRI
jgi:PilZ domain